MIRSLWKSGNFARRFAVFVIILVTTVLYSSGLLDNLEYKLTDSRFKILEREASSDLVVVEIGPSSLQELQVWPWPRTFHAQLLDNLVAAGARSIAFDIDFSSQSIAQADQAFADSLRASGNRVVLPGFLQNRIGPEGRRTITRTTPLALLAEQSRLASVNVTTERDGYVRRLSTSTPWNGTELPTLFAELASFGGVAQREFYVDYGISISSIPRLSYADVLRGRFDPNLVAGKTVLVGATAQQLGDRIAVPVYRTLPGVLVQALGYESLMQGRMLKRSPPFPILLIAILLTLLLMPRFLTWSWQRGLLMTGAVLAGGYAATLVGQNSGLLLIDSTPVFVAILLSYAYSLVHRIGQLDLHLLGKSLELRRQDALMAQVVENTFDGIITLDEVSKIKSINRSAQAIFGYDEDEILGKSAEDLVVDYPQSKTKRVRLLLSQLAKGSYELCGLRKNGESFPLEMTVSKFSSEDETLSIHLIRDISSQKRAEAEANRARHNLQESIERLHEGFALFDANHRIVLSNSRFVDFFAPAAALIETRGAYRNIIKTCVSAGWLVPSSTNADSWAALKLSDDPPLDGTFEQALDDGSSLRISEHRTADGGLVVIYSDITELKVREENLRTAKMQADAANRSKSEFLANMSHELRTPLNAILGFTELMQLEALGPIENQQYRGYLGDIHSSGAHLLSIVNDILDVSKIEAGEFELRNDLVTLTDVVGASLRLVTQRAEAVGHQLAVDLPEDLPVLKADERSVKQILLNILSNAVKFTPPGGQITVAGGIAGDGTLVLSVTDTGIGIAPENLEKAQAYFGQVDSKLARSYDGTGLGLPLANELMRLHGGTLTLESTPGVGTKVLITFPANRLCPASENSGEGSNATAITA